MISLVAETRYLQAAIDDDLGGKMVLLAVKVSDTAVDPSLLYFRDRLRIPHVYQVVLDARREVVDRGVRVVPAHAFLGALM